MLNDMFPPLYDDGRTGPAFIRSLLDAVPAIIAINQIDDPDDPATNRNLWYNRHALQFTGYSQAEIHALGFEFFVETMHRDDLEMIGKAIEKFENGSCKVFGGLFRIRPRDGNYTWFIGTVSVLELKDGRPWRILCIAQNVDFMKDAQNQIVALTRENLQLKNQLQIGSLTRREKEVVLLITKGYTDREIAGALFISPATSKTHRNRAIRKLNLKNSAALVNFALNNGLS